MASSFLKLAGAACLAIALLAGCGDMEETVPGTGTGTGSSTYTGTGTQRTTTPVNTSPTTGAAGNTAGSVYGTVPTGTTFPGQATPSAVAATPAPTGKGLEAAITAREESGIFSKSLKGVTVSVANRDSVAGSRFLLVIFTKKGHEVDVQYKSITMSPGNTATYSFKTSKDADDAKVELRDGLL